MLLWQPVANSRVVCSWSIVNVFMLLHLYNLVDAEKVCGYILKLLRPQPGSMIIGASTGTIEPGVIALRPPMCELGDKTIFRHSQETMRDLWERVAAQSGVKVKVSAEYDEHEIKERERSAKLNEGSEKEQAFFQGGKERRIFFAVELL
jgi:hypothetical protein